MADTYRLRRQASGSYLRFAFRTIPARFAIVVFTLLILVWAALLSLPFASKTGTHTPFIDALFTAVSAICVTGLSTVDMATHWSVFGDILIVLGAQIGAIGVLSLAAILGLTVTGKLGLKQRLLAQSEAGNSRTDNAVENSYSSGTNLGDMRGLLGAIIVSTLVIEFALMLLLLPQLLTAGYPLLNSLWYSAYLAITTFTNTGFVPMHDGLDLFVGNPFFLGVMALGVFLGSIGFPVIFALWRYVHQRGWRSHKRLGLHAKLTLTTTLTLIITGWIFISLLEYTNSTTFGSQNFWQTALHGFYTSVMTRSGGFTVINPADMNTSTHLVLDMLMFVGGGSASTAGGIKVTTLAVLILAAWSEARGFKDIQVFGRHIPQATLRIAVSVVIWGASIVAVSTIAIAHLTDEALDRVLFEVISGFATCGLSTGLSSELPVAAKLILLATIWAGRVGTVTLASAVATTNTSRLYRFPEERPIVG